MAIDYSVLPLSKGSTRFMSKLAKKRDLAQQERECRRKVNARDRGRCVVSGCKERGPHKHHIQYRSKGGKWRSENVCSLCPGHHDLVHRGKLHISGNADGELVITGETRL